MIAETSFHAFIYFFFNAIIPSEETDAECGVLAERSKYVSHTDNHQDMNFASLRVLFFFFLLLVFVLVVMFRKNHKAFDV